MSEADEKRELSALARSIDALFTGGPAGRVTQAEPSSVSRAPAGEVPEADLERDRERPEPVTESGEPDVGPGESTPEWPEPTAVWTDPAAEAHDPPTEPQEPVMESAGAAREDSPPDVAAGELRGSPWEAERQEPRVEDIEGGADADGFARAVDAFLTGSPGAAAEVEARAAELRERLALDPLADAVERLARDAGDPPDAALIDMAGAIINPAVASRIVQRIGHERDDARKAEYTALCQRVGEIMAKAFRGALTGATDRGARRAYYDILIAMGDTSRPIIEAMLDDENAFLVRSGVAILGELGGDRAVQLVTSSLAHPDARVRREALLSLANLGHEDSGALVVGFLDDPDPGVRVAAATAVGTLKVQRALRPLLALLEAEGDGAVPFIHALGQLGDPGAVPAIEKHAVKTLFSKPPTEVRIAAYRALHRIGTPHARDLVQEALMDKEPAVRVAVRGITGQSGEQGGR